MAYVIINDKHLTAIADELRKLGGKETYKPREMAPDIARLAGDNYGGLIGIYFKGEDVPGAAVETLIKECVNDDGTLFIPEYMWLGKTIKGDIEIPFGIVEIPANCFKDTLGITDVEFPAGLTTIGDSAFQNAINEPEATITFGPDVQVVGSYAFADNTFKVLQVNSASISIGENAFNNSNIEKLEIVDGDSITIGNNAFNNANFEGLEINSTNEINIGDNAFSGNTSFTNINLTSDSITIGAEAFYNSDELTTVNLNANSITLGEDAFGASEKLSEVNFTLANVPGGVFIGCGSLEHVDVKDEVTEIGARAFKGCFKLQELPIPANLQAIGDQAFYQCGWSNETLYDIELPNTVFIIGAEAFQESALGSIKLSDNLLTIKDFAFVSTPIRELTIPGSVRNMGIGIVQGCEELHTLNLGEGITTIPTKAFVGNTNPTTSVSIVNCPSTLKSIGEEAFMNNPNTWINLNEGLETIGKNAFRDTLGAGIEKGYPVVIHIPSTVKTIGDFAFANCHNFAVFGLVLPEALETIGICAFADTDITGELVIPSGVTSIGAGAFENCSSITSVVLPEGITDIKNGVFSGNENLTSVELPDSLVTIGYQAFKDCNLTGHITIPPLVTTLGKDAFRENTNLTSVTLNDQIQTIGACVFNHTGITELSCPASLTSFDSLAFSYNEINVYDGSLQKIEFNLSPDHQLTINNDYTKYGIFYGLEMAEPTASNKNYITFKGQGCQIPKLKRSGSTYHIFKHPNVNNANTVISVPWSESENPSGFPWGATNATIIYNNGL